MKEKFFLDIPAKDYHADAASGRYLSSHNLAQFRACPYTYSLLMTGKIKRPDSPSLAFGRAVHTYTLEGFDAWNKDFVVDDGPINERTGQAYGRTSKKFQDFAAKQTKELITTKEFEMIEHMAESVWIHPDAKDLLATGEAEGTIRVEDFHGLPVQVRLDWFSPDYGIVDLKTTREDLSSFEREARHYGYAFQLAFYRAVLAYVTGIKYPAYIIAVEKEQPYRVATFKYADEILDQAEAENEKAIAELIECRGNNIWHTRFRETRLINHL